MCVFVGRAAKKQWEFSGVWRCEEEGPTCSSGCGSSLESIMMPESSRHHHMHTILHVADAVVMEKSLSLYQSSWYWCTQEYVYLSVSLTDARL